MSAWHWAAYRTAAAATSRLPAPAPAPAARRACVSVRGWRRSTWSRPLSTADEASASRAAAIASRQPAQHSPTPTTAGVARWLLHGGWCVAAVAWRLLHGGCCVTRRASPCRSWPASTQSTQRIPRGRPAMIVCGWSFCMSSASASPSSCPARTVTDVVPSPTCTASMGKVR
jgi:hypothetical protein